MRRQYIYKQYLTQTTSALLRTALFVLLSVLASLTASAQLRQDDDGNYIIASKADFLALASNKAYWSEGRSFVQIFDIDLEGAELTPIGYSHTNDALSCPFTGTYDGRGHTISNGVIYWDKVANYWGDKIPNFNYGLFGYIYGIPSENIYASVKNLNIDRISISRSPSAVYHMYSETELDIKLGILAGQLGEYVKIHDISITNCSINDGGIDTEVKAIMAGGLAADLYKSTSLSTTLIDAPGYMIKNIYANVNIDLSHTSKATGTNIYTGKAITDDHQYIVGGILGRMRKVSNPSFVPDNTVFTGTIVAPTAMVSPTVANVRSNQGTGLETSVKTYAGEYMSNLINNASFWKNQSYDDFVKTRMFYGYRVYNSDSKEVDANDRIEEVTAEHPSGGNYLYGTRTFTSNAKNAKGNAYSDTELKAMLAVNNPANWGMVQGVNFGTYSNPKVSKDRDAMLALFTGAHVDSDKCHWEWYDADSSFRLVADKDDDLIMAYIETDNSKTPPVYRAKLGYKGTSLEYPGIETGTIQWQVSSSVKDDIWENLEGANSLEIPFNMTNFYRFKWTKGEIVLTSGYMAPTRTVYVFNHDTNNEFNEAFDDSVTKFNYNPDPADDIYAQAGDDSWAGESPEHAVKTMKRAFELLDEYGNMYTNKIVVMGYYRDEDYLQSYLSDGLYAKPVTITGKDSSVGLAGGIMGFARNQAPPLSTSGNELFLYFQAPLRLDNIDILRHWTVDGEGKVTSAASSSGQSLFVCNYYDFTVDENVRFINFTPIRRTFGMVADVTSLPFINIIGGTEDCNADAVQTPIRYPSELHPENFYTTPGVTTINIRSGVFGRIICCGRNDGKNLVSSNITGSPDVPNRIRLNINITDDIDLRIDPTTKKGRSESSKYGFTLVMNSTTKKLRYNLSATTGYSHNIGLISGGQTDGSVYGDVIMNVYGGHIGRIITSNITYGRVVDPQRPTDSYYGRAILNIYGNNEVDANGTVTSQTTINEVFGGMLGRMGASDSEVRPYFYGQSVINMYGGYIGAYTGSRSDNNLSALKKIEPNLYGVGSGGVTGLGTDDHHTTDQFIPYYGADDRLYYGDYATVKASGYRMPVMTMADGKIIDLKKTQCEVNLYSGYIQGSVYGAGYGYSNEIPVSDNFTFVKAPEDIGVLYGDSKVTMHRHPDYQPPIVLGNVYGSGAGSGTYADYYRDEYSKAHPSEYAANPDRFQKVASQYGNTQVIISDGVVGNAAKSTGGDVYGGGQGIAGYENIASLFGSTHLTINGGTIYGNIYGGSELANINRHASIDGSGNTNVTINGGTIGNNIFGGSKGVDADKTDDVTDSDSKAIIDGSTNVTVVGGDFLPCPYIDLNMTEADTRDIVNHRELYRTFNIYGGGYMNCDVRGDANVSVYSSLLHDARSIVPASQNPNAASDPTIANESNFHKNYMDITYRCFCVYGGGFGEKTNVMNTNVYVTIPREAQHAFQPNGYTLLDFLDHQSFFDIAGGGYSGDVGYWVTGPKSVKYGVPEGTRVSTIDMAKFKAKVEAAMPSASDDAKHSAVVDLYDHYKEGKCKVTIDDYTFARKIIGGGFYGSCRTTNTHVRCGSLRQVYGGSLLGYVHDKAYLQFGNRTEDFLWWNGSEYVFSEYQPTGTHEFLGDYEYSQTNYPSAWNEAQAFAKQLNDFIFITENIYGGNDVKGIIGTQKWEAPESTPENPIYGVDETDGGPLFCTDIDPSEEKGIVFNIYGGTFMGDVYSAGNGHYRGYYVPEWVRYDDGPARMYRMMKSSVNPNKKKGAYRSRPMVGSVNVNIRGNSPDDMINLRGNFFGGGRECTIGQFNTLLPLEDPRRLVAGGHLHVNFGGYLQIDGNVYLGAEGRQLASQQVLSEPIDLTGFDGSTTAELARLGDLAYDHWYFDTDRDCYLPGYPAPDKVDGNFGMKGEHMLSAFMQNVQLQGDLELTFYRYLYERDKDNGHFLYQNGHADDPTYRVRKRWMPGEVALVEYDSPQVVMNSFFLGGLTGSMTNNNVMTYTYPASTPGGDPEPEPWGTIYRIVLPEGVTIHDKVVMGSENAIVKVYPYTSDYTALQMVDAANKPVEPTYTHVGGIVTQHTFSYDLIVYNDKYDKAEHYVPADFYTSSNTDYQNIINSTEYTLTRGDHKGETIYRMNYSYDGVSPQLSSSRYSLALIEDASMPGSRVAYIGPRDYRAISDHRATVTKLTIGCRFDQVVVGGVHNAGDHNSHYGGNIYGGCYNSGLVIGDVVMNIGSNLLGSHIDDSMIAGIEDFASLKHNIGRVFGGGFGKETRIEGDTYVNLLRNFKGMNVFGGGMKGDVTGTAHVTYIGTEDNSFVYGSIYGGGLQGYVGTVGETVRATIVRLFSGNVQRVYGGSCMGDLHGRAFVELCDQVTSTLDHLDYARLNFDDWGGSRLIVGKVFGGNDIAGNIIPLQGAPFDLSGSDPGAGTGTGSDPGAGTGSGSDPGTGTGSGSDPGTGTGSGSDPGTGTGSGNGSGSGAASSTWAELTDDEVDEQFQDFTTGVYMHEVQDRQQAQHSPSQLPSYPGKTSPGSNNGYNGFPLVGDLYGGSNGDYGIQGHTKYISGLITLASGYGTGTETVNLAGMDVPHIDKSHVLLRGGSVINAYGGGDMCNITEDDKITVDYPTDAESAKARAGFENDEEMECVWTILKFSSDQQRDEVTSTDEQGHPVFQYQVCRLFGGNNNADMAIQPSWALKSGYIGSLYSGGNFGKMTFYQAHRDAVPAIAADPGANPPVEAQDAQPEVPEKGLTLTVNSYDLVINNVYGGGRVGDIDPAVPAGVTPGNDFYGATLNIERGIIEQVYGGNDVSGYVSYGTNVNLYGAISGDVYCAGNGNYFYKYDREGLMDYSVPANVRIIEDYAFRTDKFKGTRYFWLPAKADYGFDISDPTSYNASDAQTIMAINSYRPNVERAKIFIQGSEDNLVWVRGNVYCGGNSATVTRKSPTSAYDVIFDIGSHVILNGVFLGSNGASLSQGEMIMYTEKLNSHNVLAVPADPASGSETSLDMIGDNDLTLSQLANPIDHSAVNDRDKLYPSVLDLYMRAVETTEKPKDFHIPDGITNAYIGEFCVGGNRGSMLTDKCISLTFPESLTIFNHIIGGCKDANVSYNGYTHIGGLTHDLAEGETTKIEMSIKSRFRPLNLIFPDVNATPPISISNSVVGSDGQPWTTGKKYYTNQQCNIFGGCFTSGTTVGDIKIDLYSDMLNYECDDTSDAHFIDKQALINGLTDPRSWRSFTVVGGGYGAKTAVYGNISVRMLPEKITSTTTDAGGNTVTSTRLTHPSATTVFGGSQEGLIVGNTSVEIRDGKILANVYGASEAAKMYGSTSVIIGYPRYYRTLQSGNYRINRSDYMSKVARKDMRDGFDEVVVPKSVAYIKGEIIPQNVYDMVLGRIKDTRIKSVIDDADFRMGKSVDDFFLVPINAANIGEYFKKVTSSVLNGNGQPIADHIVPEDFGVTWSDINIWIGDQASNLDPSKPFYGQGNVYGGGYIPNTSDRTLVGQPTVMRFTEDINLGYVTPDDEVSASLSDTEKTALAKKLTRLYGGNTAVMIWDDERNADLSVAESAIRDHVHIGSGYFKKMEGLTAGSSRKGLFEKVVKNVNGTNVEAYVYQTTGRVETDNNGNITKEYYDKVADGGVYGGGRKVFAQAFRSIDLAYYGYAEHTPQSPKLLNTIQRADVATVTDCCIDLVGASDFTMEDYKDIYYAINRVGELRMISSLDPECALDPGVIDENDGVRLHNKKRSRNYIALYNTTNHLGAFRSNWSFEKMFHLDDGSVTTSVEKNDGADGTVYGYPYKYNDDGTEKKMVSYVNRKHRYVDMYNKCRDIIDKDNKHKKDNTKPAVTSAELDALNDMYYEFMGERVTVSSGGDLLSELTTAVEELFRQRNVGTSGNMIGISSGYRLSIEGLACVHEPNKEVMYYGPAYGITEMKLLTTVSGMGGGYVYALNHHYDPAIDGSQIGVETSSWCAKWGQDFLQTTGNFVFPGASYMASSKDENGNTVTSKKRNFIIDDCFDYHDPINHGYYACDLHDPYIIRNAPARDQGPASRAADDPLGVNHSHEIHYWYVSGNTYVYNVTITGITSDTSPEKPRSFWLSNENDIVNLFNVKDGTEVLITDVTWFDHDNLPEGGSCDVSDLSKQYQLYLTIDHDTRNSYTQSADGAFVIRVPRHSYEMGYDETLHQYVNAIVGGDQPDFAGHNVPEGGVVVNPNIPDNSKVFGGTYTEDGTGATVENKPRLGLRLVDGEHNRFADRDKDYGVDYYNKHLKPEHELQITLQTNNPGSEEPIIYVINVNIRYLMGPALFGNIDIENCALPGEYIYVNAKDVEVLMDENLGVSEQKWKLYPNDPKGFRYDASGHRINSNGFRIDDDDQPIDEVHVYDALFYDMPTHDSEFAVEDNERLIHIPAYYYQNGWEVAYAVKANGEYFETSLPFLYPDDYSVAALRGKTNPDARLQIHNYHRMKPMYKGDVLDLHLVKGARIYIEDQTDMDYFFDYINQMQASSLPSASKYERFMTPDGRVVNPQYSRDLDFYQLDNFSVPTKHYVDEIKFAGNYHGNGNWMEIPKDALINISNYGALYNTGFVSLNSRDNTIIYNDNVNGTITNCFYFNHAGKGALAKNGRLYNCYQNTPLIDPATDTSAKSFAFNELMQLSTLGFRYGQVAYNLNGFYLQKRHSLLHYAGADNNEYALHAKDRELRVSQGSIDPVTSNDMYDRYAVSYIEDMFNNGDYRYAFYNQTLQGTVFTQFTEALRTAAEPNYLDRFNNHSDQAVNQVSMHDYSHKVDEARWCDTHNEYHPLYDVDYLFFGEDLTVDLDDTNVELPVAYNPANRVYRTGGFYGSAADKGYFMNRQAYLDTEKMTAIDFVGYRDRDLYEKIDASDPDGKSYGPNGAHGALKSTVEAEIATTGWIIDAGRHEVFMPPTLDLPWQWTADDGSDLKHDFESFDVNSDKVTHNLLIYTEDIPEALNVMQAFQYQDKTYGLGFDEHSYALHPDAEIRAHHIIDKPAGPEVYGDYFHLVDKHDFNAPVSFSAKQAWYNRQPIDYSSTYTVTDASGKRLGYQTAWEGICLPFDVKRVYAASTNITYMRDMGEITHFFDEDSGNDWKGHEYWLRRYKGVSADDLIFQRPMASNMGAGKDLINDYVYSNDAIYQLYKDLGYDTPNVDDYTHDLLYHFDDPATSRTIKDYRYLSRSIPYIVNFPGKDYYEFDLSGKFYASLDTKVSGDGVPQTICYLANDDESASDVVIPVTDDVPPVAYSADGYTMRGTFVHVTDDTELAKRTLYDQAANLMVLDAVPATGGDEIHLGTEFKKHTSNMVILPFRTYVTPMAAGSSPAPMRIGAIAHDVDDEVFDYPDEPASPTDEVTDGIRIWTEGRSLMVSTPYDVDMYIFNTTGQTVRRIRAYEGVNRYSGLPSGFYIVHRTKILIP